MSATVFGIIFYQLFDGYSSFGHLAIVIILAAVMGYVVAVSVAGKNSRHDPVTRVMPKQE